MFNLKFSSFRFQARPQAHSQPDQKRWRKQWSDRSSSSQTHQNHGSCTQLMESRHLSELGPSFGKLIFSHKYSILFPARFAHPRHPSILAATWTFRCAPTTARPIAAWNRLQHQWCRLPVQSERWQIQLLVSWMASHTFALKMDRVSSFWLIFI